MEFLLNIDILSPKITFYQNGKLSHSSIFSGILTLISFLLCFIVGMLLSDDVIHRKNPTSHFFKKFEKDLDSYYLNSSGIFHFFRFSSNYITYPIINSSLIRIIGIRNYSLYINNRSVINEGNIEYWIYDKCQKDIDTKDFDSSIFSDISDLENFVCLKYYFNPESKNFYKNTDKNFKAPYLIHGSSNKNNLFYYMIIESCRNDSNYNLIYGNNSCGTNEEIKQFKNKIDGGDIYFVDNYIDVSDFKRPIHQFIQSTSCTMNGLEIPVIHLQFYPSKVYTHSALFTDSYKVKQSFLYNAKESKSREIDNISIGEFAFWIENNVEIYDRTYKKIQSLLADLGGIIKIIILVTDIINYPYNKYITLKNSSKFLSEHSKKHKAIISTSIINGSNFQSLIQNSKIHFSIINNYVNSPKKSKTYKNSPNSKYSPHSNNYLETNNLNGFPSPINRKNTGTFVGKKKKSYDVSRIITLLEFNKKFNFHLYLNYLCLKNKKNEPLYLINNFRKRLLSEEHLYLNHIKQFLLFKQMKNDEEKKVECDLSELYSKL